MLDTIPNQRVKSRPAGAKKGKSGPVDQYIAARFKVLRNAAGVSLKDLAHQMGLTHQQLNKYEHGEDRISAGRLFQIAGILNVPLETFFPITSHQLGNRSTLQAETNVLSQTLTYLRKQKGTKELVRSLEKIIHVNECNFLKK